MDRLLTIEVFARVGETLSFSRAAESLAAAPLDGLDGRARARGAPGTRLVNRTTRRVSSTADGVPYLEWCRRLLADIERTETRMRTAADGTSGRLRVEVPGRIARRILCPALPEFLARHPRLALEMGVSDRTVDLVDAGIDCAIRVGELGDTNLVARPIGALRVASVASRSYLSAHGVPTTVDDLAGHAMVQYAGADAGTSSPRFWYGADGAERSVEMRASLSVDDAETYIACCRAGLGLIQVPAYDVRHLVRGGELVEVLADVAPRPMPLSAVYPERRYTSGRVRAFVDWVQGLHDTRMRDA